MMGRKGIWGFGRLAAVHWVMGAWLHVSLLLITDQIASLFYSIFSYMLHI